MNLPTWLIYLWALGGLFFLALIVMKLDKIVELLKGRGER